jgi:hypothetical protein
VDVRGVERSELHARKKRSPKIATGGFQSRLLRDNVVDEPCNGRDRNGDEKNPKQNVRIEASHASGARNARLLPRKLPLNDQTSQLVIAEVQLMR